MRKPRPVCLALFDLANKPLAFLHLALCQLILAPGKRIFALAKLDAHRRAFEFETLAEEVFQITVIAGSDVLGARAVDHDRRRIAAARMRETQAWRMPAYERRLITGVSRFHRAG